MKEIKLNGHTIEMYESIEEMPMWRYHKFTQYMVFHSGMGTDVNSVTARLRRITMLVSNEPSKAVEELENLSQSFVLLSKGVDLKGYAFVALIFKIDGKEYSDLSEEGVKRTYEVINKASYSSVSNIVESVKKKLTKKWRTISRTRKGR